MYEGSGLVVTEFGAESTFAGPASEKETYAFQTRYIQDVLQQLAERPWVGGAIYWTLREFAVKPDWDGGADRSVRRDAIHNKGLISYAGLRKPAWSTAAQDFGATPLYRSVSPTLAAGLPQGGHGGSPLVLLLVALAILAGLAVDLWAVAGILDLRLPVRARRTRAGARPHASVSPSTALTRVIRATWSTAPPGSTRTSSRAPRDAAIRRQRRSAARPVESTNSTRVRSSIDAARRPAARGAGRRRRRRP